MSSYILRFIDLDNKEYKITLSKDGTGVNYINNKVFTYVRSFDDLQGDAREMYINRVLSLLSNSTSVDYTAIEFSEDFYNNLGGDSALKEETRKELLIRECISSHEDVTPFWDILPQFVFLIEEVGTRLYQNRDLSMFCSDITMDYTNIWNTAYPALRYMYPKTGSELSIWNPSQMILNENKVLF